MPSICCGTATAALRWIMHKIVTHRRLGDRRVLPHAELSRRVRSERILFLATAKRAVNSADDDDRAVALRARQVTPSANPDYGLGRELSCRADKAPKSGVRR